VRELSLARAAPPLGLGPTPKAAATEVGLGDPIVLDTDGASGRARGGFFP